MWSSDDPRSEGDSTSDGLRGHRSDPLSSTMIHFLRGLVRNMIRFDPRRGGPRPPRFRVRCLAATRRSDSSAQDDPYRGISRECCFEIWFEDNSARRGDCPSAYERHPFVGSPRIQCPPFDPFFLRFAARTEFAKGGIPHRQFRRFPVRWSLSSFRVSKGERFPFEPERSGSNLRK